MKASPRLAELIASLSLAIDLELASGINRVRTFEPAAARGPYETSGRASYDAGWRRLVRLATGTEISETARTVVVMSC
jgi:hypothetical protein